MVESHTIAWYADIGAENARKIARTKRFKVEAILRDQVIIAGLSSKTLEELDGIANKWGVVEEEAKRFLAGNGVYDIAAK